MPISLYSHTQKSFEEAIFAHLGKGKRHAGLLYSSFFKEGKFSLEEIEPQAMELAREIIALTDVSLPEVSMLHREEKTVKFLLKYIDGLESESVLIPMIAGWTLCVSSQVGCKRGCSFCETAKMGIVRNLDVSEIIAQVCVATFVEKLRPRNIVFMGMGEPFDNFDTVKQAIAILTDPSGFGMGPSRITISTSGHVAGILKMMEQIDPAVNLAVSINAPTDGLRNRLMPINRTWDLAKLKEAMVSYCSHPRRQILAGYVLLKEINDSLEYADQLVEYLQGLKVKINLIPYNPQRRDLYGPSSDDQIAAFASRLQEKGMRVLLRKTKGQKIMAACGQLGKRAFPIVKIGSLEVRSV